MLRQVITVSAVLLLGLAGCRPRTPSTAPTGTLAVLSHLEGVTAPCGCTSRPLGGLDRIAQYLVPPNAPTVPWVAVGNTYLTEREPKPALLGYTRTTAQIVAGILARLHPVAVAPGPWDLGPMAQVLTELPAEVRAGLGLRAPDAAGHLPTLPEPGRLVKVGPLTLGLLQAPPIPPEVAPVAGGHSGANSIAFAAQDTGTRTAAALEPAPAFDVAGLARDAAALRQAGAQGVLLLWPHGADQARALLGELTEIDVVLAGNEEAPRPPETLGSATLLDAGARGEHLGLLHVVSGREPGAMTYFDGGKSERLEAEAKRQRLITEAERLAEGPARTARLTRVAALDAQLAAIATTPPTHSYFTWEIVPIEESLPKAAWATQALDGYNEALCASAMADTAARECPKPEKPEDSYVGTAMCQSCHQEAYAVWQKTAHARAWATLEQAHKTCDLSCVGCHVVGFEQPGGFCHLADAGPYQNVGCESCHGPGLGHVQAPTKKTQWSKHFVRNTPEATCRGCHNAQHSDQFNFETYRPRVLGPGHGLPLQGAEG